MIKDEPREPKFRYLLALLLVAGFLGRATPSLAQGDECLLEFQDDGGAIGDKTTICKSDPKVCTFNLKLCVNQSEASCTTADLKKKKIRAKGHCGSVGKLSVRANGTSAVCGTMTGIQVKTKKHGTKTGTCRVSALAGAKGRKDKDTLTLECHPNAADCPTTTTTTSTTTSTIACVNVTTTTIMSVCGNGMVEPGEACDDGNVVDGDGCDSNCTVTGCGNGITTTGEDCDPPCGSGCGGGQICDDSCHCVAAAACTCGAAEPTLLRFTTGVAGGQPTGSVSPATCTQGGTGSNTGSACTTDGDCTAGSLGPGVCRGHLDRNGLYFGGDTRVPLPATIPNMGTSFTKTCCGANSTAPSSGTAVTVAATSKTDTGVTDRTCTSVGCLFGPPLPIVNGSSTVLSTCVINTVSANAVGTADCVSGDASLNLPLNSQIYLTGDVLDGSAPDRPNVPGVQPCPVCIDGTCKGGPRNGCSCTPGDTDVPTSCVAGTKIGASCTTDADCPGGGICNHPYPTSHDCPPDEMTRLGAPLPIPFALTTGTATKTASDTDGTGTLLRVFCGFCGDETLMAFQGPPAVPCTSNADCTNPTFASCLQRGDGAFWNKQATTITETGTPGGSIMDRAEHDSTLVSVFCIPPTFSGLVDPAAGLPGPGAVSLSGKTQLQ